MDDGATSVQAPEPDDASTPEPADERLLARELILKAHPEIVPELVTGETLAEMLASISAAEAAYARVVATARQTAAQSTAVPGGGAVRSAGVNVEGLGPLAKIRAGLDRS